MALDFSQLPLLIGGNSATPQLPQNSEGGGFLNLLGQNSMQNNSGSTGGFLSNLFQGAGQGASAGPLGAIAGAGLGLIKGILGNRAQKKAEQEAKKKQNKLFNDISQNNLENTLDGQTLQFGGNTNSSYPSSSYEDTLNDVQKSNNLTINKQATLSNAYEDGKPVYDLKQPLDIGAKRNRNINIRNQENLLGIAYNPETNEPFYDEKGSTVPLSEKEKYLKDVSNKRYGKELRKFSNYIPAGVATTGAVGGSAAALAGMYGPALASLGYNKLAYVAAGSSPTLSPIFRNFVDDTVGSFPSYSPLRPDASINDIINVASKKINADKKPNKPNVSIRSFGGQTNPKTVEVEHGELIMSPEGKKRVIGMPHSQGGVNLQPQGGNEFVASNYPVLTNSNDAYTLSSAGDTQAMAALQNKYLMAYGGYPLFSPPNVNLKSLVSQNNANNTTQTNNSPLDLTSLAPQQLDKSTRTGYGLSNAGAIIGGIQALTTDTTSNVPIPDIQAQKFTDKAKRKRLLFEREGLTKQELDAQKNRILTSSKGLSQLTGGAEGLRRNALANIGINEGLNNLTVTDAQARRQVQERNAGIEAQFGAEDQATNNENRNRMLQLYQMQQQQEQINAGLAGAAAQGLQSSLGTYAQNLINKGGQQNQLDFQRRYLDLFAKTNAERQRYGAGSSLPQN